MQKKHVATLVVFFALVGVASHASAQVACTSPVATSAVTSVSSNITTDTTWGGAANPGPIVLESPIFVESGAELTILPGTIVRGQPRTAAVAPGVTLGTPGALIVTQDGQVDADASASNPIIMTTAAVDNNDDGVADDLDGDGFLDAFPGLDPTTLNPVTAGCFLDDTPTTAPLAPLNTAGFANVSLWGGLVILGNAPTNLAEKCGIPTPGYGKCTVEGLTVPGFPAADATYGGVLPHDNSGTYRYVSVRHAGDELGAGNELNGVTLAGVGDGTTYSFIEVYANFDDGHEWFGGTVNGDHLVVTFAGDDQFDLDQGYTGVNQFLWTVMPFFNERDGSSFGSASGDKAGEFDGDDSVPDPAALQRNCNIRVTEDLTFIAPDNSWDGTTGTTSPWPLSHPAMYNITAIVRTDLGSVDYNPNAQCTGSGTPFACCTGSGTGTCTASDNEGVEYRNGFAGATYNAIVLNTGALNAHDVDAATGEGCPGSDAIDNVNNDLAWFASSVLVQDATLGAAELASLANGDAIAPSLGGAPNLVNPAGFSLVNSDVTFDPTGNSAGKLDSSLKTTSLNPRVTGATGFLGGVTPQGTGLDPAANFRGAFGRTGPLWTNGWTVLSQGGLLAD